MPKPKREHRPRLFVDASVLVAATLSASGGSFRLCRESSCQNIHLSTNRYAVDESQEAIQKKYPHYATRLKQLVIWSMIKILKDPPENMVSRYLTIINPEDAPILAGAICSKAQFLLTLDRKDFMTNILQETNLPLFIITPRDFFQRHYLVS